MVDARARGATTAGASRRRIAQLTVAFAFAAIACAEDGLPRTPASVRRTQICKTTTAVLRQTFGAPASVGLMAGQTTWTWGYYISTAFYPNLIVLLSAGRVVDCAYNVPGLVELRNRCA